MGAADQDRSFRFLFRTDRGVIGRDTWWRGTVPLAIIGALATLGWLFLRPYTHDAITQPPALAVLAYVYLLVFSFGTIVLLICEYNLSAKRFVARGWPRAAASALPLALLLAGAMDWYVPRSQDALPSWSMGPVWVAVAVIVVWNIVELGVRNER